MKEQDISSSKEISNFNTTKEKTNIKIVEANQTEQDSVRNEIIRTKGWLRTKEVVVYQIK